MDQDNKAAASRGWVARQMIAEDARWAIDLVLSSERSRSASKYLSLILGHHIVRIAYEGSAAIRSDSPYVGVPKLAALLEDEFKKVTERTRHSTKMLDDSGATYEKLVDGMEQVGRDQEKRFSGNSHRWLRWLETDLGLYKYGSEPLGATTSVAYRLGFDISSGTVISFDELREAVKEWGSTLSVLSVASLDVSTPVSSIDFDRRPVISASDHVMSKYFSRRYGSDLARGLKLIILMIEGDLNTSRLLMPRTIEHNRMAVFRARVITAYHALASLKKIRDKYPTQVAADIQVLTEMVDCEPSRYLLSTRGKKIRDRCMHYTIKNPTFTPDLDRPMYGIIESIDPTMNWERFNSLVVDATEQAAASLASWRSRAPDRT